MYTEGTLTDQLQEMLNEADAAIANLNDLLNTAIKERNEWHEAYMEEHDKVNEIKAKDAEISRLTSELDAAQKTIAHWESHDFEDDIDDATAEISEQLVDARRPGRGRAQTRRNGRLGRRHAPSTR